MHRSGVLCSTGAAVVLTMAFSGCSSTVSCDATDQVLVETDGHTLTCGQADLVGDYVAAMAGRPFNKRGSVHATTADLFRADPTGTESWLVEITQATSHLYGLTGFDGAEERSHLVWLMYADKGPITHEHPLWSEASKAIAVWQQHDEDQLTLTESDIEGWIQYGSLCREMQGAGVLRVSVSDRVGVYKTLQDRWTFGTRTDRIALTSIGPFWHDIRGAWKRAPYETQHEWGITAPLPPPMTSTSLGYMAAIAEGDLVAHASILHATIGPFHMARR